jgi:hypothetical protein
VRRWGGGRDLGQIDSCVVDWFRKLGFTDYWLDMRALGELGFKDKES